jgi:transposase-like protein
MSKAADQQSYLSALNTGHPGVVTSTNQAGVVAGVASLEKASTVTQIRARNASCDCPHCGAESYGWLADPRGRETECEECGLPFVISAAATVSIS